MYFQKRAELFPNTYQEVAIAAGMWYLVSNIVQKSVRGVCYAIKIK